MQIWHYHPTTGELIGVGIADPNPVDIGEWILPAFSTTVAPGASAAHFAQVFNGSTWSRVADRRGETWWQADATDNTEPVTIDFLGDPAAQGLTHTEPPAPPVVVPPIVVNPDQIRRALTQLGLRAAVEAYVAAADQDLKDMWQFSPVFERANGVVKTAALALGKTDADLDALFELAKSL